MYTTVNSKKVKFSIKEEIENELKTGNYEKEIIISDDEMDKFNETLINDLDLDTIRSKSKSKGIKNIDYSDDDEEVDDNGVADETLNTNWDAEISSSSESESGEEEQFVEAEVDDREIQIEPFNLKTDREEGTFDSEGFFQKSHDTEADQDRWMNNLTRSDISEAKAAHEKIERERERKQKSEEEVLKMVDEGKLYRELYELISGVDNSNSNPSVLDTIRSLSVTSTSNTSNTLKPVNRAPLNKNRLKKLEKEQKMMADVGSASEVSDDNINVNMNENAIIREENRKKINRITEITDTLLNRGNLNIYEETRREILSRL